MIENLHARLVWLAKDALVKTPWRRRVLPRYAYNFNAAQLVFLCQRLEQTRNVPGCIVEVGAAGGETTLFLNSYLSAAGIDKEYVAVDTFAGFVESDIDFEVNRRGKREQDYQAFKGFTVNSREWYDATMQMNGVTRVRSVQADVNSFDLRTLGAISFCLLDVDLYRPMVKALSELYKVLSVGGIMVVDDCSSSDPRFDGALEAYREFARTFALPEQIVHEKLGLVRK